jgi:hypothetical protein
LQHVPCVVDDEHEYPGVVHVQATRVPQLFVLVVLQRLPQGFVGTHPPELLPKPPELLLELLLDPPELELLLLELLLLADEPELLDDALLPLLLADAPLLELLELELLALLPLDAPEPLEDAAPLDDPPSVASPPLDELPVVESPLLLASSLDSGLASSLPIESSLVIASLPPLDAPDDAPLLPLELVLLVVASSWVLPCASTLGAVDASSKSASGSYVPSVTPRIAPHPAALAASTANPSANARRPCRGRTCRTIHDPIITNEPSPPILSSAPISCGLARHLFGPRVTHGDRAARTPADIFQSLRRPTSG